MLCRRLRRRPRDILHNLLHQLPRCSGAFRVPITAHLLRDPIALRPIAHISPFAPERILFPMYILERGEALLTYLLRINHLLPLHPQIPLQPQ